MIYERRQQARAKLDKIKKDQIKILEEEQIISGQKDEPGGFFNSNRPQELLYQPVVKPLKDLVVGNKIIGIGNKAVDFDNFDLGVKKKKKEKMD